MGPPGVDKMKLSLYNGASKGTDLVTARPAQVRIRSGKPYEVSAAQEVCHDKTGGVSHDTTPLS
ncbi:MAG: hypothetical protein QMD71_10000 [bacterium]|nr:hypothetical protein [bacterium]